MCNNLKSLHMKQNHRNKHVYHITTPFIDFLSFEKKFYTNKNLYKVIIIFNSKWNCRFYNYGPQKLKFKVWF